MTKKRRRKKIRAKNPLKLLVYQNGLVVTPLHEAAALGQRRLDAQQRAITLGEPVPIVFCRRVDGVGGVLVSPGATEGRYSNDASTNTLTVRLQLVLSEGDMPQLKLKDVFQQACRVGTWRQTYNRRAGSWTPGNFITTVSGFEKWDCPVYCGTSGTYANLTTLSFTNQFGYASTSWDKQVHCFVREGMQVTRIIDSTVGSSNNVIDLALYLIRQSSRLPEDMLDTASMLIAAQFTNANGLLFNGVFEDSSNLEDWLQEISLNFLLRFSDKNGKKAFLPRLPYNEDYTIKTTAITWVFGFTEEHITPDGFEIEYIPLSERKPICAQMLWREQPDDDIGIVRTTEVRFSGEAESGPFEQYDLTQFCTSENHAVKVGTYIIARRKYVTHTVRLRVKPDAYNGTLVVGDIVRVQLRRETDADAVSLHDYLYEVERINKSITGAVELDLVHFPVDSQNRSIIAQIVGPAVGINYNLATGREDFTCDESGRRTDNTDLTDEGGNLPGLPADSNFESIQSPLIESQPVGGVDNPADPVVTATNQITDNRGADQLDMGDTLNLIPPCPNGRVDWYRRDKTTGVRTLIKSEPLGGGWEAGSWLSITTSEIQHFIEAEAFCPDPSSPTGFGTPIAATSVEIAGFPQPPACDTVVAGFTQVTVETRNAAGQVTSGPVTRQVPFTNGYVRKLEGSSGIEYLNFIHDGTDPSYPAGTNVSMNYQEYPPDSPYYDGEMYVTNVQRVEPDGVTPITCPFSCVKSQTVAAPTCTDGGTVTGGIVRMHVSTGFTDLSVTRLPAAFYFGEPYNTPDGLKKDLYFTDKNGDSGVIVGWLNESELQNAEYLYLTCSTGTPVVPSNPCDP